jgi:hypothetical protein
MDVPFPSGLACTQEEVTFDALRPILVTAWSVCSVSNQAPSFSRAASAVPAALRLPSANKSTASASFLRAVSSVSPRSAMTRVSVGQAMSSQMPQTGGHTIWGAIRPMSADDCPSCFPIFSSFYSALRCEKTAQNYGSFVALALGFILIKSVHTA